MKIYYDNKHVPHVFGINDKNAFYGFGYAQMSDFPIATLMNLWRYSGRFAEILGNFSLPLDEQVHRWNIPKTAAHHATVLPPDILELLQAYADGVEARRREWYYSDNYKKLAGATWPLKMTDVTDLLLAEFASALGKPTIAGRLLSNLFKSPPPSLKAATITNNSGSALVGNVDTTEITLLHVIAHGLGLNAASALQQRETDENAQLQKLMESATNVNNSSGDGPPANTTLSNAWLLGQPSFAAKPSSTYSDVHVPITTIDWRAHFAQIHGDRYQASGWSVPGWPGIIIGYNHSVSWTMTQNGVKATTGTPVLANRWKGRIHKDPSTGNAILNLNTPAGITPLAVKAAPPVTLKYFDPKHNKLVASPAPLICWFVKSDQPAVVDDYPILKGDILASADVIDPRIGDGIVHFEQGSFAAFDPTGEGVFSFLIKLGRANGAAEADQILKNNLFNFRGGLSFLLCDVEGKRRFARLGRVPRQGRLAMIQKPWLPQNDAELDGNESDARWRGMHRYEETPNFAEDAVKHAVWITNNVSPDVVRPGGIVMNSFPEYMLEHSTVTSWRQIRARELLGTIADLTLDQKLAVATDKQDPWMNAMWDFLDAAVQPVATITNVHFLRDFIHNEKNEGYQLKPVLSGIMHYEKTAEPSPHRFIAHKCARHPFWTTLLRGLFEKEYARFAAAAQLNIGTAFGFDPGAPAPASVADFMNNSAWIGHRRAMAAAWKRLGEFKDILKGNKIWRDEFEDSFPSPADSPWADFPADPPSNDLPRWGHANFFIMTPGYVDPVANDNDTAGALRVLQQILLSLDIPNISFTSYFGMAFRTAFQPFNSPHTLVFPVGGSQDSLYRSFHTVTPLSYKGYAHATHTLNKSDLAPGSVSGSFPADTGYYWIPNSFGSRTMLHVELLSLSSGLGTNKSVRGFYLSSMGQSEIALLKQPNGTTEVNPNFYSTTADFLKESWTEFITNENILINSPGTTVTNFPNI